MVCVVDRAVSAFGISLNRVTRLHSCDTFETIRAPSSPDAAVRTVVQDEHRTRRDRRQRRAIKGTNSRPSRHLIFDALRRAAASTAANNFFARAGATARQGSPRRLIAHPARTAAAFAYRIRCRASITTTPSIISRHRLHQPAVLVPARADWIEDCPPPSQFATHGLNSAARCDLGLISARHFPRHAPAAIACAADQNSNGCQRRPTSTSTGQRGTTYPQPSCLHQPSVASRRPQRITQRDAHKPRGRSRGPTRTAQYSNASCTE